MSPSDRAMSARPRQALAFAGALACALSAPVPAQQSGGGQSMTLEELESYIEEQRVALERAEENRRITREKEAKVLEELARREERRKKLEAELRDLCEERVAVSGEEPKGCEAEPAG